MIDQVESQAEVCIDRVHLVSLFQFKEEVGNYNDDISGGRPTYL